MVEHSPVKRMVVGSNPTSGVIRISSAAEQWTFNPWVGGSSPPSGNMRIKWENLDMRTVSCIKKGKK